MHYAGVGCEMDEIMKIAGENGIAVVEDNAHGLFAKYKERWLGTFGCLATQSFHETKNIACGEGGALVIDDPKFIARAEIIREKGTDRSRFFRGQVDKYTWVDIGSSYVMSDVLAAFLFAQLENWKAVQARRREIWEKYRSSLEEWARDHQVRLPIVPHLLPASVAYVLPPHAFVIGATSFHYAFATAGYISRFSLLAASSFCRGSAIWWQGWKLSSYRGCERSSGAPSILQYAGRSFAAACH